MKLDNNNKNIIKRITNSSLKSNKGRNIFVVLAIVLTTFMICSVFSIGISFVKNYKIMSVRMARTTANVYLDNPSEDQIKAIKNLGITNSIGKEITAGQITTKKMKEDKTKIFLKYYDKENWEKQIIPAIGNVKGNYPIKENEVMMSQKALELLKKEKVKIGDKINISYIDNNGNQIKKDFVLSGTYMTYGFRLDTGYLVVSEKFIKSKDLNTSDNEMLSFTLKNSKKNEAPDLLESNVKLAENQFYDYGYDITDDAQKTTINAIVIMGTIGLFIVLSGYLLIYNIMYIAVTKDIHFYGLMKTIGTTPKQIRKVVRGQVYRLSIIGIPIGLILGGGVSFILVPMTMNIYPSSSFANAMPSDISFNPLIFIGTALFSLFTVSLSCRKPAKIASNISPTEALRYSGAKQNKSKNDRKSTNGGKLYKMAWYNVFRDKKRATLVFLSLFMGIVTYLSVNTYMDCMSIENYINRYISSDFRIENREAIDKRMTDKFIEEIENIEGVESVIKCKFSNLQGSTNQVPDPHAQYGLDNSDKDDKALEKAMRFRDKIEKASYTVSPLIVGVDDLGIERFNDNNKKKIDVEAFKSGKLALIDNTYYLGEYKIKRDESISREKITLKGKHRNSLTFHGVEFINDRDLLPDVHNPAIYISSSQLEKLDKKATNYMLYINVDKKYNEAINYKLREMTKSKKLFMASKIEQTKDFQANNRVMNILGGGMSIILILIGLLNFINVTITGINTRLKELAVMESIGMTKKQIKKMLTFEGLYYAGITTLLVSTLGTGILFMIGKMAENMANYAKFAFPTVPFISLTVFIFVVCVITPSLVYKDSTKRSITERIREVEK